MRNRILMFFIVLSCNKAILFAQMNIAVSGISFVLKTNSATYTYGIDVRFTSSTSNAIMIYSEWELGYMNSRYCNLIFKVEEKKNGVYQEINPYISEHEMHSITNPEYTYDFAREPLAARKVIVKPLAPDYFARIVNWQASACNPTKEFRIKAIVRVGFINNNARLGTDDYADHITYKESGWVYFKSKY